MHYLHYINRNLVSNPSRRPQGGQNRLYRPPLGTASHPRAEKPSPHKRRVGQPKQHVARRVCTSFLLLIPTARPRGRDGTADRVVRRRCRLRAAVRLPTAAPPACASASCPAATRWPAPAAPPRRPPPRPSLRAGASPGAHRPAAGRRAGPEWACCPRRG